MGTTFIRIGTFLMQRENNLKIISSITYVVQFTIYIAQRSYNAAVH